MSTNVVNVHLDGIEFWEETSRVVQIEMCGEPLVRDDLHIETLKTVPSVLRVESRWWAPLTDGTYRLNISVKVKRGARGL